MIQSSSRGRRSSSFTRLIASSLLIAVGILAVAGLARSDAIDEPAGIGAGTLMLQDALRDLHTSQPVQARASLSPLDGTFTVPARDAWSGWQRRLPFTPGRGNEGVAALAGLSALLLSLLVASTGKHGLRRVMSSLRELRNGKFNDRAAHWDWW